MTIKRPLDRIDRKILFELMQDATIPIARLADRVGLSQTPCWKRVQKLEAAGIITRRVALVDPDAVGFGLTVLVEIEAADHSLEWRRIFVDALQDLPEVQEAHRLAGEVDYLLKVAVSDMGAYDDFYLRLTSLVPCRNVTSKFSMERVKISTAFPLDIVSP